MENLAKVSKTRAIEYLLTQEISKSLLDSGSIYGYNYEENRKKDLENIDPVDVDIWDKDDIVVSFNIYHFLHTYLKTSENSRKLNSILFKFHKMERFEDIHNFDNFLEYLGNKGLDIDVVVGKANTYNYDNILSQGMIYEIFSLDGEDFIILSVHGGCDIRGGYSQPYIAKLEDRDYFIIAQLDVSANCNCGSWMSDDAGYSWYYEGSTRNERPLKESVKLIESDEYGENKLVCKDCNKPLKFYVMLSY